LSDVILVILHRVQVWPKVSGSRELFQAPEALRAKLDDDFVPTAKAAPKKRIKRKLGS